MVIRFLSFMAVVAVLSSSNGCQNSKLDENTAEGGLNESKPIVLASFYTVPSPKLDQLLINEFSSGVQTATRNETSKLRWFKVSANSQAIELLDELDPMLVRWRDGTPELALLVAEKHCMTQVPCHLGTPWKLSDTEAGIPLFLINNDDKNRLFDLTTSIGVGESGYNRKFAVVVGDEVHCVLEVSDSVNEAVLLHTPDLDIAHRLRNHLSTISPQ